VRYLRRARGKGIKCIQSRISSAAYSYDKTGDMDEIWRQSTRVGISWKRIWIGTCREQIESSSLTKTNAGRSLH